LVFSIIAFPIVFIVCIIFGILIKTEDGGTVFYLAKRRGKNGIIFNMYKLRSMKMNAPDIRNKDNSTFNSENDPRVTKIGRIMRKTSVDELPQVFNIIKGDMSWIGPRPVTTDRPLSEYDEKRIVRLKVRPGVTGYTQAYFRNNISQEEKLELDAEYAKKVTFVGDLKIFFKTIETVVKRKNVYTNS
jgi:undecaprenyl phosphate N,N'-diacetylbacillosamine 1-phosphate transferase